MYEVALRSRAVLGLQGRMKAALEYLNLIPGEATADVAVLRDRIYRSGAPGVSEAAAPPPFPYIAEDLPVAVTAPAAASYAAQTLQTHAPGMPAWQQTLVLCMGFLVGLWAGSE